MSIDGKIAPADRDYFALGSKWDRHQMMLLRKKADGILMGASSLRTYQKPLLIPNQKKQKTNIILSRAYQKIDPEWPFFQSNKIERILFFEKGSLSKKKKRALEKTSELIAFHSKKKIPEILKQLKKRKINRLLIEGGGEIMWLFLKENRIDEIHLTLTARVLGGKNAPTLVDGAGFNKKESLQFHLKKIKKIRDELFLTYRKKPSSNDRHS